MRPDKEDGRSFEDDMAMVGVKAPEKQVVEQLEILRNKLDNLAAIVDALGQHLSPVVRPVDLGTPTTHPDELLVPLAFDLYEQNTVIENIAANVNSIIRRLEI